jgi:hypothetical protein
MTTMSIRDVSLFVKTMGTADPPVLMQGGPGPAAITGRRPAPTR